MPDGNSAAESKRNADEAAGESLREQYSEKALEDLVWRVMDGQTYPCSGRRYEQVNMIGILSDADAADVAGVICLALIYESTTSLRNDIEAIVKDYLRDSSFHEKRIAEMIEEARDDEV